MISVSARSNEIALNFLPEDKILTLSKLKAFADDKLNVTQNRKFIFRRRKNIVGKEENAVYHFLLFPQCFKKISSTWGINGHYSVKSSNLR